MNDLDDSFNSSPVKAAKPTPEDVLGCLVWSEPREVQTSRGPKLVSSAPAGDLVFAIWREFRDRLSREGYSVSQFRGVWQISKWSPLPEKVVAARTEALALSRATDAEINVPVPDGLALLPFQKAGVAFMLQVLGASNKGVLLADQMGLGKTVQAIAYINCDPSLKRILVVCPASLKLNWRRECERWLVRKRQIFIADSKLFPELADGIVIVNYDVLHKHEDVLKGTEWDYLVCDEAHYCFPAGTLVETSAGPIAIDQLVSQRSTTLCASADLAGGAIVWRRINGWYSHETETEIIRLTHDQGFIDCTRDHRIFVEDRGWTRADAIEPGDQVRTREVEATCSADTEGHMPRVREEFFGRKIRGKDAPILYKEMQRAKPIPRPALCRSEAGRSMVEPVTAEETRCCYQNDSEQPDAGPSDEGKDFSIAQGSYIPCARRQRQDDKASRSFVASPRRRLGNGVSSFNERSRGAFASDELQSGYSARRDEDRRRGRWELPQNEEVEISRSKEDGGFSVSRVESVQVLERSSGSRTRVYCIDVEEHHNFFANGVLVHNCKSGGKTRRGKMVLGARASKKEKENGAADIPGITARKRIFLTGTPIANRPAELFPLISYLDPINWPDFFRYGVRYCAGHRESIGRKTHWDFSGSSHLDELQEKLRTTIMIRRLKKDVLTELPPKRRQVIEIPTDDPELRRLARSGLDRSDEIEGLEAEVELAEASEDPAKLVEAVAKLKKGAKAAFEEMSTLRQETGVATIPYALAHIREVLEEKAKLVIFGHHKEVLAAIKAELGDSAVMIVGDTPMDERQRNADRFQNDPTCTAIIGSFGAMGVGWTLTAAEDLVTVEQDWVPGNVSQAEDRIHRIGQKGSVLIQHLVLEGSLGATIMKRIVSKQNVIDAALDKVKLADPERAKKPRTALSVEAEAMTDDQGRAAVEAIQILAARCNGARDWDGMGFSKIDTRLGKELAAGAESRLGLSRMQRALCLRVVKKYARTQLPESIAERLKGGAS